MLIYSLTLGQDWDYDHDQYAWTMMNDRHREEYGHDAGVAFRLYSTSSFPLSLS